MNENQSRYWIEKKFSMLICKWPPDFSMFLFWSSFFKLYFSVTNSSEWSLKWPKKDTDEEKKTHYKNP